MLNFNKYFLILFTIVSLLVLNAQSAIARTDEIDNIRAELAIEKDKTSPSYIRNKERLNNLIEQYKIDYSPTSRLEDALRLINEKKYNSAVYELKDLISIDFEKSKCYELLGDIYIIVSTDTTKSAKYYKKSVQEDDSNISATFKLAKQYFKLNKNIIGTEYLRKTIDSSQSSIYFPEIENLILNNIKPQNRYEANNLYEALGVLYFKTGKKNNGYNAFSKAIQLNPDDIALKYQLVNLLYDDNQNQNAALVIDSILKQNPTDSQMRSTKAKILLNDGDTIGANKEFLTVLKQYPSSNQARYGIYQIYKNQLNPIEIIKKFHNNPNHKVTSREYNSFLAFLDEINDKQGVEFFRNYLAELKTKKEETKVQEKENTQLNGNKNLENKNVVKQEVQQIEQEVQQAKEDVQLKKMQEMEDETINQNILAKRLKKQEQEKAKQLQIEKKRIEALEKKKQDEENKKKKEKLELEKQEKSRQAAIQKEIEAKRLEEKKQIESIEKQKKSDVTNAQNELKQAQNSPKYLEYKKIIDNYLKTTPMNVNTYIAIANTYKQAKMPYNAIKYFEEAKKLEPTNSDIYYNIGLTYMELNRIENSKENLDKAINLDWDNKKAQNLLAFVNQKIVTSIINKAYSEYEKKKYVESYLTLDEGIKKISNNGQLYYYRALVEDAMNRNSAAIIDFQKAIDIDPAYYMAYYYLGKSYEKVKDFKNALVAYERFLSIEPDEEDLVNEIQKKVIDLGQKYY